MILFAASSGLAGLAADAREFAAAVRVTHVDALWLLLVVPVLGLFNRWAARRRRATVLQIGRPAAVAGQLTQPGPRRRWLGAAYPLGLVALVLAVAGPRWGRSDETGVAVGRDSVILLDLSQSMRAGDVHVPAAGWHTPDPDEQYAPKRWLAARAGALDLLDGIRRRGGHRVAVVVFAAHPKVLCPLTTDYDHVRTVLEEVDGEHPPPECRPGVGEVISGTRIGAGLVRAVDTHDSRFPGFQDIFLLSDGDDPGDDNVTEWRHGTTKARERGVPVYTVGIGNPEKPFRLELGGDVGEVDTQLQEAPLEQIAAETRGQYIAARTNPPQLGEFFCTQLEPLPSREVSDDTVPLPKERYTWFLLPALGFFLIGWLRGR